MTNTRHDADKTSDILSEFTAAQRDLVATLRKMEAKFKQERDFILQHHPEENIGEFPSLNDSETMNYRDLDIRKVFCGLALGHVERRASEVQEEVDEAERKQREQNLTEMEMLKRALYSLAARVTKLEGGQPGRLPALPHTPRAKAPEFLGMPGGMGRHAAPGPSGGGGVRKLATNGTPITDASADSGFTRRQHPLDVIGSSGRRG